MLKQKKAIIFDMDGVVIDSEPLHERASQHVLAQHNIEIDNAVFANFKGSTDRAILEYLVQKNNLNLEVEELIVQKRETYASLIEELQPIPGALLFIEQMKSRYRLALTTSASRTNKELAFSKFGLDPFFEVVITSNDITRPKPDPEPYQVTVSRLELTPDACVVIEDSYNGVRSAARAGCTVVGLTTSFDADSLKEAGAHLVVDGYEMLENYL